MKQDMKKAEWLALTDLLLLPICLYAYGLLELIFWIVLIYYDQMMLKSIDKEYIITLLGKGKPSKRMLVFTICYAIGLGIVAYKNLKVASVLLVNEFLITLVAFIKVTKEDKK